MGPELPPVLCWGFFNFGTTFNGGIMLGYFPHPLFFPTFFSIFVFLAVFPLFRFIRGGSGKIGLQPTLAVSWSKVFPVYYYASDREYLGFNSFLIPTSTQQLLYDIVFVQLCWIYQNDSDESWAIRDPTTNVVILFQPNIAVSWWSYLFSE